ncbi:MAG: conjugal transfer protein TraD [Alphaproteobacteria bacterium]
MTSLEQKRKKVEQQRVRLQQMEALIKLKERKKKISQQIKYGSFIEKADLLSLSEEQLLGALLSLKESLKNTKTLKDWEKVGGIFIEKSKKEIGVPLEISFTDTLSKELSATLKSKGFKFNRFRSVWEGLGNLEEFSIIVEINNGKVKEISR